MADVDATAAATLAIAATRKLIVTASSPISQQFYDNVTLIVSQ
jgi:hypothetical protein